MSACICAPFNCAARTLGSIAVVVVNICAQQRSCYCSNRSDKMVMLYFNRYTRNRKMSRRRIGVTYNVSQAGTGRIIFNENKTKFMGLLVGADGECISLRGSLTAETDDPSTSMMTVTIIDGESGNEFQIENVMVNFARNPNPVSSHFFVTIDNPCIQFTTSEVLYGNRADVEIQKFMDPSMVENGSNVHVGPMSVQLMANHRPKPPVRRESVCDNCNPAILEISDDFLA